MPDRAPRPPWHRPFAEQLAFFRNKLNLASERWDDISKEEHDRAFIVAGAQGADLLADLNGAVTRAIADGSGLEAFRQDFKAIVARHGWSGWTGEGSKAGVAWRTKVIYQTNMATSYAAGRWQQLNDPELQSVMPYWRYKHSDSVLYPRPLHVSWDGLTLPPDHPFWKTHFPPNGWHCFPGDTPVRCVARVGLRSHYTGEMVELQTRGGNRLTVTANHPILTRRGWLAAHQLQEGDQLLGAALQVDAALLGVVDHQQPPARAEDLFKSLAAEGLRVVPMAADDFHGDAQRRKPEVYVAGADRALMDVFQAARRQQVGQRGLHMALHGGVEAANVAVGSAFATPIIEQPVLSQDAADGRLGKAEAPGDLHLAEQAVAVERQDLAFSCVVSGVGNLPRGAQELLGFAALLDADPAGALAVTGIANGDPAQAQDAPQGRAAEAELFRQLLEANPGLVATDEIISIRKFDWSGHVYDFSTESGLILAGGLVVSNCHCRVIPASKSDHLKAIASGKGPANAPATGNVEGVDRGFAYAPGASVADELKAFATDKAGKLPAPIGKDFAADAAKALPGSPFAAVQFAEAKTAREAGAWAIKNNLVDHADYTGIKPEVANAINESLLAHLQEFPELRASQKFIGTAQAQMARHRENEIERYLETLRQYNNNRNIDHILRPIAESRIKMQKIDNRYAQASSQNDVAGIGVNRKWGADPEAFKRSLAMGVDERWHPVGTYTLRSVADHEFGHMLDFALNLRLDPEVIATYKEARAAGVEKEVSGYAATNIQEFIAECWGESINNPSPRPYAARIASLVRSRYRARFAG